MNPIGVKEIEDQTKQSETKREVISVIETYAYEWNRKGMPIKKLAAQIDSLCEQFDMTAEDIITIFHRIYKKKREEFGIMLKERIIAVEFFLKTNWKFALNEVTQQTECRAAGEKEFDKLNIDSIFRRLQHAGFKFGLDKLKSLLSSDFVPNYNPFTDYFNNLPVWDNKIDYIKELAAYIETDHEQFFATQFKKSLVRSIRCALDGIENRIVFVLVGEKQNTGKSTFLRFLNPFDRKYYIEAPIRDNKDSEFAFAENFLYNLEELSSLNNIEINKLKAIISKATVKERRPYAHAAEEQPRRCSFWGSTNKSEFLTDTENTRWLCFDVKAIDWSYKKEIDIHNVWSQAFSLYGDGRFNDQLTKSESDKRDQMNKGFEVTDVEKELIMQNFSPTDRLGGEFYSNSDILKAITEKSDRAMKLNPKMIGKSMIQLGFLKGRKMINGHVMRGYYAKASMFQDYKNDDEQQKLPLTANESQELP